MARILFLAHRIPYPPNKGDKIRSWNFLNHLRKSHDVHLAFFIDNKDDKKYLDFLSERCASIMYAYAAPLYQKLVSLRAFFTGKSLTESAYPSRKIRRQVNHLINTQNIDLIFVYSAAPFAWLPSNITNIPIIADLVDVDSAKWAAYAEKSNFLMKWIYKREAETLEAFENVIAQQCHSTLLVSSDEAALFRNKLGNKRTPNDKIIGIPNGVNCEVFKPSVLRETRDANRECKLVFTGAMDYAPNVEAVLWFVDNVLHELSAKKLVVELVIAGGPIAPRVKELSQRNNITVLGRVPDMAAIIETADIIIAPLQTARGIQNKVLEGMAMAKPVIATSAANEGINANDGEAIIIANSPEAFARKIEMLINEPERAKLIGARAREYVKKEFSWPNAFQLLDNIIIEALEKSKGVNKCDEQ